jgi:outer membrane protein
MPDFTRSRLPLGNTPTPSAPRCVPPTRTFPPRRPRVTGTSSLTEVYLDNLTKAGSTPQTARSTISREAPSPSPPSASPPPRRCSTASRPRAAHARPFSARETLRTTEQNTLLNAATAYMNLLQTAAILELQRSNVNVLEVTLR